MTLTQERLKELLDFDENTGVLRWRHSRGGWGAGRVAGTTMHDGYRRIGVDKRQYQAHELVWLWMTGEFPEFLIDHKDLDRDNNRFGNLRRATSSQNLANQAISQRNTSGFKGVSRIRANGRWLATIKVMGKSRYLGTFDDPEIAHRAYVKAAENSFGEFARAS